jgi:hypothetical protein
MKCGAAKKSDDRSGKADLVKTGDPEDMVQGVVYEFDPAHWCELDAAESGYDRVPIHVDTDSGALNVTTYLARKDKIDESRVPYTWYLELINCGAEQHGLLENYRGKLGKIHAIPDPIENRREKRAAEAQIEAYRKSRGLFSKDRS